MTAAAPSGVVTFLFTDIEGSTRRWEADAAAMRAALLAHDAVLRSASFRLHYRGMDGAGTGALPIAHLSADRLGGDVQKWLDESVMARDTAETERDQTELGGEG
jgi:class 3 adenylate cyclase